MQKRLIALLFMVLPIVAVLSIVQWGKQPSPEDLRRGRLASLSPGDPITFGVLWSDSQGKTAFLKGVEIAIEEINEAGGLLGRKVEALHRQFGTGYLDNMHALHALNQVPGLAIILGFPPFRTTLVHLELARYYGIPILINSQEEALLRKEWNRELSLRGNASTGFIAETIAAKCEANKYDYVIVVRRTAEYDDFFKELADLATNRLLMKGMRLNTIVLDPLEKLTTESLALEHVRHIEGEKKGARLGAVVLAADPDDVLDISQRLLVDTDIESAVTYLDFYESGHLEWIKQLATLPKEFYIVSNLLDAKEVQQEQAATFVQRYYKRYQNLPSSWSIAGYDQAKLVAGAIASGASLLPRDLVRHMKAMRHDGISQDYSFTKEGELKSPDVSIFQAGDLYETSQVLQRFATSLGLKNHQGKRGAHEENAGKSE